MSDTSAPLPEASAADHLRWLRQLNGEGRLAIKLDFARLDHMDSPVGVEADSNIFVYAFLAAAALAWWLGGLKPAGIVAAVGVVVYFTYGRVYVRRRLARRVTAAALEDITIWQKLWNFGGVTLAPQDGGEECAAPKGNWMALVRRLRGLEIAAPPASRLTPPAL